MALLTIDWDCVDVVRSVLHHEGGTKFYEVIVLWPLIGKAEGEELEIIDHSKNALVNTRWGPNARLYENGSFGNGELIPCNLASKVFSTKVSAKTKRGYEPRSEATGRITGQDARRLLKLLGYLGKGYDAGTSNFFSQLMIEERILTIAPQEKIAAIKTEKVKPIIRSPLYGSW